MRQNVRSLDVIAENNCHGVGRTTLPPKLFDYRRSNLRTRPKFTARARHGFTCARHRRMIAPMAPIPQNTFDPVVPLPRDALARSLAETIALAPQADALWLFAYGSLIWSPCFSPAEIVPGTLRGYHRAFNIWTIHSRGTPEAPGLALGLEPGGTCRGMLFRIAAETRHGDLEKIWRREMYSGLYSPRWLPVECRDGVRSAICFLVDEAHPQYAGEFPPDSAAAHIVTAEGAFGRCRDYLFDLLDALAANGIKEPDLETLASLVRMRANADR